ncbi:hypothetical protein EH220_04455 [bacterium]|nr:MAG: hypothetical protein EH220_04455 [bacterium]
MPLKDGTGPPDGGPQTGRRLGWCSRPFRQFSGTNSARSSGARIFTNVILPLGGAVLTDLMRPNSTIRRITGEIIRRLNERRQRLLLKQATPESQSKQRDE